MLDDLWGELGGVGVRGLDDLLGLTYMLITGYWLLVAAARMICRCDQILVTSYQHPVASIQQLV